ncbi:MAG: redoxin domain-containing protein [Dysgonamonadaceae bacterium]|nr:redoxin domain-containing protein [Dysgonamonadaceae bacterium]
MLTSCKNNKNLFIVEGNIPNLTNNNLYVVTTSDDIKIDTVQARLGKFYYKASSDSVIPILIYMEKQSIWMTIWAQNGDDIKIEGDVNCPELIAVKGNEINNLLTEFKSKNHSIIQERCDLVDEKNPDNDARINDMEQFLKEEAKSFIQKHPSSVASLVLIQDYLLSSGEQDSISPYLSMIEGYAKNDRLYKKLTAIVERYQRTAIGNPAPDFSLISTNNDTLTLSNFKNKYLLLTFETSECDMCDEGYADLVAIRKKYSKKQLEMMTVVLNEDRSKWEKMTENKKNSWYQVVEARTSEMRSLYNVTTVPYNYLIDEKGLIFAKDISPDSLKHVLKEQLKKVKS